MRHAGLKAEPSLRSRGVVALARVDRELRPRKSISCPSTSPRLVFLRSVLLEDRPPAPRSRLRLGVERVRAFDWRSRAARLAIEPVGAGHRVLRGRVRPAKHRARPWHLRAQLFSTKSRSWSAASAEWARSAPAAAAARGRMRGHPIRLRSEASGRSRPIEERDLLRRTAPARERTVPRRGWPRRPNRARAADTRQASGCDRSSRSMRRPRSLRRWLARHARSPAPSRRARPALRRCRC